MTKADFDLVASRHKWAPGALEMARKVACASDAPKAVRRLYELLAAELRTPGAAR